MTHYDIDYASLSGKEKMAKAIADIRDWLGNARFEEIDALFRQLPEPMPYREFTVALTLSGIAGYPLTAWHSSIWGEDAQ